MCPSPDDLSPTNEAAASGETPNPASSVAEAATQHEAPSGKESKPCFRPPVLFYTAFSLMTITFVLFILYSWSGYAKKYAQVTEGWTIGQSKLIEITLVKADKEGLACASDLVFEGGIRCGYRANQQAVPQGELDQLHTLQPFNTIKNELFIASGLWNSKGLSGYLPGYRFTVVCNYHVVSVAKSMSLRWGTKANFDPLKQSVAIGTLTDCVIPQ